MEKDYKYWIDQLADEAKDSKDWRKRGKMVVEQYRIEQGTQAGEYNILWANTETIHSVLFNNTPKPNVSRRFKDKNAVAKTGSEILERALEFSIDQYDFVGLIDSAVNDYLLPGAGNIRVRYKPYFEDVEPLVLPVDVQTDTSEDGSTTNRYFVNNQEFSEDRIDIDDEGNYFFSEEQEPELAYEEVTCELIEWERFRWDRSVKSWEKIKWSAIDYELTNQEIENQFGSKIANQIQYEPTKSGSEDSNKSETVIVTEIFDLEERKTIVISEALKDKFLSSWDDPLGLRDYAPFPKPLFANLTSDELEPTPDYLYYQEQAIELNDISKRINVLVSALRVRGAYDDSFPELADIANAGDNVMTPVSKLAQKLDNKKIDDVLMFLPIKEIVEALTYLYKQREEIKQQIYEITGISDIVRGQTKASETATAQQIKSNYAGLRIARKQKKIQEFIRDILRIKAEIIAEHFSEKTLSLMTGIDVTPEIMEMLRSDVLRTYNVTIETDSTIQRDESQEKKDRAEILNAINGLLAQYAPAVQSGIMPAELAKELILFAVRAFKGARQLEEFIEQYDFNAQPTAPTGPGQPGEASGNVVDIGSNQ